MARPSDARSRLVRVASALFRQRGYDGVGLAEILSASGAPKGSFYHHFPDGKEQLAEACLAYTGNQIGEAIDTAMGDAPDFPTGVRRLLALFAESFERSGHRDGCPVASIALALVPQSAAHGTAVQTVFDDWQARLAAHAARLGHAFVPADAERLLMLVEGAWILARIRGSKAPLLSAAEAFLGQPADAGTER